MFFLRNLLKFSAVNRLASIISLMVMVSAFDLPLARAQTAGAQPSTLEALMPFLILMGLMYFFLLRPQARRMKEHQSFVSELKRGDEVVTSSGILGKIDGMTDAVVTLEVADGIKIQFLRSQIASSKKASLEKSAKTDKTEKKK